MPAICGAVLVLIGLLIYMYPRLLELAVAGLFVGAGVSMMGVAWKMRPRVRYRRLNDEAAQSPNQSNWP